MIPVIGGTQQNNTDFQPASRRRIYAKQNGAGGDDQGRSPFQKETQNGLLTWQ